MKTDSSAQPLPGDFAIWIFIFAELLVFGVLFSAYALGRMANVSLFDASQATLNRSYGLVNTLTLVTSSYFVVRATRAIRLGRSAACARWLSGALGLGALFLAVKLLEFQDDFSRGITLSTNLFYMFYLSLTFFHFMHVVLGMIILGFVTYRTYAGAYDANRYTGVETGASYWHMVDLVWIILFALIYVLH